MSSQALQTLRTLFDHAVATVSAQRCVPPHLPDPPAGRTVVIGAGKAAAAMAQVVEQQWSQPLSGLVVTRYGHAVACERIEVIEAAHPVPDQLGQQAAQRALDLTAKLNPDDLVLFLVSGGGSALLSLPAEGITLQDKQDINRALLRSGANIAEMNCVRKHLSRIKGGRLAAHCRPAQVLGLVVSDVPGDDPSVVASGPTVPDATTSQEALALLDRYRIDTSTAVRQYLQSPNSETPKPGEPIFDGVNNIVIARAQDALDAAIANAQQQGIDTTLLGDDLQGEARSVGAEHADLVQRMRETRTGAFLVLSGGETTVTVQGNGRGGRNVEYLLGLALALDSEADVYGLAADTDGIDGTEDNAGAVITPDTLKRARQQGLDGKAMLENNDAYSFFAALGDLIVTGPTLTNVNDFRGILVAPPLT